MKILRALIETYENDFDCGYEGDDKEKLRLIFLELIVGVTRYVNGFKYCSNTKCPCSPETKIKNLLIAYEKEINEKLFGGIVGLSDTPFSVMKNFLKEISGMGKDSTSINAKVNHTEPLKRSRRQKLN